MKDTKQSVLNKIKELCIGYKSSMDRSSYNSKFQDIVFELNNRYNIPLDISSDILSFKMIEEDQNEFVLFCILDVLDKNCVGKFYTDVEIKEYRSSKFIIKKFKLPYTIDMIQITDNQWIGKFTVKDFMKLRDANLIHYNENTQRPLKHKINGDEEYYIIDVDRVEVESIMESFRSGSYIPNTITLNIPEDAEWEYENNKLTIRSISNFDITDGYHRYIAMSNLYNIDKKFDYDMELRITQFEEEHAMHFIWQEDQKHKMTKAASEGLNQQMYGNQVVNRLKSVDVLKSAINRNDGIIDAALLGKMIDLLYFHNLGKVSSSNVIKVYKEIKEKFEEILYEDPYILDKKWDMRYVISMIYCFKNSDNIIDDANKMYDIINEDYKTYFSSKKLDIKHITKLNKIYEGGDFNV